MPKVLIAVPTFENIYPDTYKALWEMDKGGNEVIFDFVRGYDCASARNNIVELARKYGAEYLSGYNPYYAEKYFNVGVCLFNLEQMRQDNAQTALVHRINAHRMNCVEQDALNKYAGVHRIAELPTRFNENRACGYTDNPAIQHYVGYMDWLTNPNLPRREYLKLYRDKSWKQILKLHEKACAHA